MVIGITGGIASGKSTFSELVHNIYTQSILLLTDNIAKDQQKIGEISYQSIVDYFGTDILNEDKSINSKKLGEIVFQDKEKLEILNKLTHPNVINYVKDIIKNNKDKLIIIESALLFDTELKDLCDKTIYVDTPDKMRINRMKYNRHYSDEKIKNILDKQKLDKTKANIIIDNSGTIEDLEVKCLLMYDVFEKRGKYEK